MSSAKKSVRAETKTLDTKVNNILEEVLVKNGGNLELTASELNIGRSTIYRRLTKERIKELRDLAAYKDKNPLERQLEPQSLTEDTSLAG